MRLGKIMSFCRRLGGDSIRAAAAKIGISAATLSRFERGENIDGRSLIRILGYVTTEEPQATEAKKEAP